MDKLEKIVHRIWSDPAFKPALLVGGLIFYLPIINFLILGYFSLYLKKLMDKKGLEILAWSEGAEILRETLRILPVIIVYLILPSIIAGLLSWAIQGLMFGIGLDFFALTLGYIPVSLAVLIVPPLFFTALWRLLRQDDLRRALAVPEVLQLTLRKAKLWILPLPLFIGWLTITWPLLGFGCFAGLLPLGALMLSKYEASVEKKA